MSSSTADTESRRCWRHPDGHDQPALKCRHCDHWACPECRVSQFPGGVPAIVCADCVARQGRQRRLRQARVAGLVAIAVLVVVAASQSPLFWLLPIGIAALWAYIYWAQIRTGTATTWTYIGLVSIVRRFLRF